MVKRKKTDWVQFKVRFREDLRRRLEAAAKAQERSLNGEIVARLEQSFGRGSLSYQINELEDLIRATVREELKTGDAQAA